MLNCYFFYTASIKCVDETNFLIYQKKNTKTVFKFMEFSVCNGFKSIHVLDTLSTFTPNFKHSVLVP